MEALESIRHHLHELYGAEAGNRTLERMLPRLERCRAARPAVAEQPFSEKDVVLITYGDSMQREGEPPLQTLADFCRRHLHGIVSTVHLLPFFPFSSDDGFSVMDFTAVDADLGSWGDVRRFTPSFSLMFDLVLNHVSARSGWFAKYLCGLEGFENLAIEVDPATDLSSVVRPRALPLLTRFQKASGEMAHLWTTFSDDQIDLNYSDPEVWLRMLDVLLLYVEQGASIIRLDAVAYLWKEIGTSCIHLPKTHTAVRLLRSVLDAAAPWVRLLSETNVPHEENISYFGNGRDEAQMVYNFTLPPLLLHALLQGDAADLSNWADGLKTPSEHTAFFNFTASHDGVGVRPLEGILPGEDLRRLVDAVCSGGGHVSVKQNPDGTRSPYELNTTYVDAAGLGAKGEAAVEDAFLASQAVQLSLPGVPAIYINSLLGCRNWSDGVAATGRYRTINREKLAADQVEAELQDPESFRSRIFYPYREMLRIRRQEPAFAPSATMDVLHGDPRVFAICRRNGDRTVYVLVNLSSGKVETTVPGVASDWKGTDLIGGQVWASPRVALKPYGYVWVASRKSA